MVKHKIIFTGTVAAKYRTEAIMAISHRDLITINISNDNEVNMFLEEITINTEKTIQINKKIMTMSYGELILSKHESLGLYITPDYGSFSLLQKIGALGIVIYIDYSRKDPMMDLRFYLKTLKKLLNGVAVVICITKLDRYNLSSVIDEFTVIASKEGVICPIVSIANTQDKKELLFIMELLFYQYPI